ncbi:MAG: hypothetical protein CMI26_02545 [Opitutae bacterium]|nr:hypothetical protein [Opitutae bacterium]
MLDLEQSLIDYSLGLLTRKDSEKIESLIAKDHQVAKQFSIVQDSLSLMGTSARHAKPNDDLKARVMEICESPKSEKTLTPPELRNITPSLPSKRYVGGGGSVGLGDLGKNVLKDKVNRLYEGMLELKDLVCGTSAASGGDLNELRKSADSIFVEIPEHNSVCSNGVSSVPHDEAIQSFLRTQLTSLPSMGYFLQKIREGFGNASDARRLFYLCRDQMKIMRASFADLDATLLAEDEELRLHGAGLLRTKWWGAEHSYFNKPGKVVCGNFFEGPVTERCVEFAEYDSNLYCLANLLGSKSENGGFQIELDNSKIPDCALATLTGSTNSANHLKLKSIIEQKYHRETMDEDGYLAHLVKSSISRAFQLSSSSEAVEAKLIGCGRTGNQTMLWFVWPSILPNHGGGEATTSNPLQ